MFDSNKAKKFVKEKGGFPPFNREQLISLEKKHHFHPLKRLGQSFLIDQNLAQEIVAALKLTSEETVYEIGPGFGILTYFLVRQAQRVVAIEKDKRLVEILKEIFSQAPNLEIVSADIREFLTLPLAPGKFIGNPPYYLSSPLIHQLLTLQPRPKTIVLLLQKELGEKIVTLPPKANRLSVFVQLTSKVRIIRLVGREAFWPSPQVDSVLLEIQPRASSSLRPQNLAFINQAFSFPRKTLLNNLSPRKSGERTVFAARLQQEGIDPLRRPGSLSLKEWRRLFPYFQKRNN